MKIIVFAGMPSSGKSEAVKIAKEMNIPVFRMGDMVWEETKKQGLEINDKNVGMIANNMRKEHGMDIWAKRTLKKIKTVKEKNLLVIDGVRNIEEIETFKKKLGKNFIVIAIVASDETRQKRFLKRGREDDSKDIQDLIDRDKRELNWGLGSVIASADIVIPNEGCLENFRNELTKIFDKI
jgi:dephospho-CoA kinase